MFKLLRPHLLIVNKLNKSALYFNSNSQYCTKAMGLPLNEIVKELTKIAPLNWAGSWDNVGMLVEPLSNNKVKTVLLTIDLTEDVVDEAVESGAGLIVSYHPNIFRPLKSVSQRTWKERIVIKCIQSNIAVFSPHTSWDALDGGVNDWLGSGFSIKDSTPIEKVDDVNPNVGMGRLLTLQKPSPLESVIDIVKKHTGLSHLRVAIARHKGLDSLISTVALCAGAGTSVLSNVNADLYLTGEMLHHDVLDATQKGIHVILCNHSDSERGFLKQFVNKVSHLDLNVLVSTVDKDCLKVM